MQARAEICLPFAIPPGNGNLDRTSETPLYCVIPAAVCTPSPQPPFHPSPSITHGSQKSQELPRAVLCNFRNIFGCKSQTLHSTLAGYRRGAVFIYKTPKMQPHPTQACIMYSMLTLSQFTFLKKCMGKTFCFVLSAKYL